MIQVKTELIVGCCKSEDDAKTVPRTMEVMSLNALLLLQVKTGKLLSKNGNDVCVGLPCV